MYREPAAKGESAPHEIELLIGNEPGDHPSIAVLYVVLLPPLAGVLVSVVLTPSLALPAMIVTAAVAWWMSRRKGDVLVLRVDDGEVTLARRGAKEPRAAVRLEDIDDVILDTKTIRPQQESASPIVAVRFTEGQAGPATERARVVLVRAETGTWIPLSATYAAHMHASELFAKVRVFLRKHGWRPLDEREAAE